ncbi:MAG: hypothetical protein U0514_01290 [Candidatus Andersenbacteria bacterium]
MFKAAWGFLWDTIGHIHDKWPRWGKITVAGLILVTVGFFFGYRAAIYVAGGALWIALGFMVVAHIVILSRNLRKRRLIQQVPLTPADQADIDEFQAALRGNGSHPPVVQ